LTDQFVALLHERSGSLVTHREESIEVEEPLIEQRVRPRLHRVGLHPHVQAAGFPGRAEQGEQGGGNGSDEQDAIAAIRRADRVSDSPMPKPTFLKSRKLSSILNLFPYSFTISAAVFSSWLVARHHGSFIPFALTHTTAPTSRLLFVTRALRSRRGRPVSGTHSLALFVTPCSSVTFDAAEAHDEVEAKLVLQESDPPS
jgi:hypothetical protein